MYLVKKDTVMQIMKIYVTQS